MTILAAAVVLMLIMYLLVIEFSAEMLFFLVDFASVRCQKIT